MDPDSDPEHWYSEYGSESSNLNEYVSIYIKTRNPELELKRGQPIQEKQSQLVKTSTRVGGEGGGGILKILKLSVIFVYFFTILNCKRLVFCSKEKKMEHRKGIFKD